MSNVAISSIRRTIIIAVFGILAGCASQSRVVFVTATDIDLGYDATLGTTNIGYDRNEFVIGPAYPETGATPPVYGYLKSNLSVFSPEVTQTYATGCAAARVTSDGKKREDTTSQKTQCVPLDNPKRLSGDRKVMFFGTTTNLGLKAQFVGGEAVPTHVNFGFKRKEFSIIPLNKDLAPDQEDRYASVLARINFGGAASSNKLTGGLEQVVATGTAAENLAEDSAIRNKFKESFGAAAAEGERIESAAPNKVSPLVAPSQ